MTNFIFQPYSFDNTRQRERGREHRAATKCVSTDDVKENFRPHPSAESSVRGLHAVWVMSAMTKHDICSRHVFLVLVAAAYVFSHNGFGHGSCGARAQLHCGLLTGCGEHSWPICASTWSDVAFHHAHEVRGVVKEGLHFLPLGSSESCLFVHFQLMCAQLENAVLIRGPTFDARHMRLVH